MKKKVWVSLLAALAALIGILAVAAAFFRKKGKRLKDDLDFDDSVYFDDDDDQDDDFYEDEYAQDAPKIDETAGVEPEDEEDEQLDPAAE